MFASSSLLPALLVVTLFQPDVPFAYAQADSVITASITPAATTVTTASESSATLFPVEEVQLTDDVVANINQTVDNTTLSSLFEFGNSSVALTRRTFTGCKTFPGDFLWPSELVWKIFDLLLGGALIKTVPSAASCHRNWPQYNKGECGYVSSVWNDSHFHMEDPTSVMWPLYQGRTCLPSDDPYSPCTVGGYPSYAVNVTNVAQIQLAINLARNLNIRLVVKNTGHDFNGKSAGAGALSIWTHHMKDISYIPNYHSPSYRGKAIKMGAGVQAFEIYAAAQRYGVTVVGGEGQTVGVAGGYVAGGGHSPLSSLYGLAADQVLAYEVVTADGRFVTTTDQILPDLFWALRGGGGSTYGVVTSVTVKAHPVLPVTVSLFTFSTSATVTPDKFWAGVRAYYDYFIPNTDAGTYAYFWVLPTGPDSYLFNMQPFFAPNHTVDQFNALIGPWFARLAELGIVPVPVTTYYTNFHDAWQAAFPLETVGTTTLKTASRLMPRQNWQDRTLLDRTFAAMRNTTEHGHALLSFNMAAPLIPGNTPNSANPAWRHAVMHAITSATWADDASVADIQAASDELTYNVMGQWRAVTPTAGAYMSEADIQEPNFQQSFYGSNYPRLYALKRRYDPFDLFYAPTAVGSENWVVRAVDGLPDQNGRLCRAK